MVTKLLNKYKFLNCKTIPFKTLSFMCKILEYNFEFSKLILKVFWEDLTLDLIVRKRDIFILN